MHSSIFTITYQQMLLAIAVYSFQEHVLLHPEQKAIHGKGPDSNHDQQQTHNSAYDRHASWKRTPVEM